MVSKEAGKVGGREGRIQTSKAALTYSDARNEAVFTELSMAFMTCNGGCMYSRLKLTKLARHCSDQFSGISLLNKREHASSTNGNFSEETRICKCGNHATLKPPHPKKRFASKKKLKKKLQTRKLYHTAREIPAKKNQVTCSRFALMT